MCHLKGSKRKALQSGYLVERLVTFSRADGDVCLPGLQNPHLGAHLSSVSHQASGTLTFVFLGPALFITDTSRLQQCVVVFTSVRWTPSISWMIQGIHNGWKKKVPIHQSMKKSSSIILRLSRVGRYWTQYFGNRTKVSFPEVSGNHAFWL